jgi:hypothetical protein
MGSRRKPVMASFESSRPGEFVSHNRVRTAREHLVKLRLMYISQHGCWALTEAGRRPSDQDD